MNEQNVVIPASVWARLRRMLAAYEAGTLGSRSDATAGRQTQAAASFPIKIDSNASGGGKYIAKLLQPTSPEIPETGDLSEEELGQEYAPAATGAKVLALNTPEKGKSTHALSAGDVCLATFHKMQGKTMVVIITAYGLEAC